MPSSDVRFKVTERGPRFQPGSSRTPRTTASHYIIPMCQGLCRVLYGRNRQVVEKMFRNKRHSYCGMAKKLANSNLGFFIQQDGKTRCLGVYVPSVATVTNLVVNPPLPPKDTSSPSSLTSYQHESASTRPCDLCNQKGESGKGLII